MRHRYLTSGKLSEVERNDVSMAKLEGEEMSFELEMQEERDGWH
jgi:hypothetical protein